MSEEKFPPGWDADRVRRLIAHYDALDEDQQVAEDEAAQEQPNQTPYERSCVERRSRMRRLWNPWTDRCSNRRPPRKKMARLVGTAPGRVTVLVKLHDWGHRAIYVYNLLTGEARRVQCARRRALEAILDRWNRDSTSWQDTGNEHAGLDSLRQATSRAPPTYGWGVTGERTNKR